MRINSHPRHPEPIPASRAADELERACRDVEALFLKQLLAEMHRAGGQLIHGGPGSDIYQELFDQALSQQLARTSNIGIARLLQRELARSAPNPHGPTPAQNAPLKAEGEMAELQKMERSGGRLGCRPQGGSTHAD